MGGIPTDTDLSTLSPTLYKGLSSPLISTKEGEVDGSRPGEGDLTGYVSLDTPIIYHNNTTSALTTKLVRREGAYGDISVTVTPSDKFRGQGVITEPISVSFADGELSKNVTIPVNPMTLDGEAHILLTVTGNTTLPNDVRWQELNAVVIIDDDSLASDGIVLTDPTTQIIQDSLADDTIVYVRSSVVDWDDASVPGYTSADPYKGRTGTVVLDKNNLVIRNYPGETPVMSANGNSPFYVIDSGYVHIRGFEIGDAATLTTRIGIYCYNEQGRNSARFDNGPYYLHSNHIHHILGGDNTGGVRLDDSLRAVVFNNRIHDIYDIRNPGNNGITSVNYQFHAGIHGYRPRDCVITQNTIYHCKRPMYQKHPNDSGAMSNMFTRNLCYSHQYPAATYEHAGADGPAALQIKVYENVCLDSVVSLAQQEAAASNFSTGAKVYNNTVINVGLGTVDKMVDVQVWGNLFSGQTTDTEVIYGRNNKDVGGNGFSYFDYNGYANPDVNFRIDRYGTDDRVYPDISAWQASTQTTNGFNQSVPDHPDSHAQQGAVMFTDAPNKDYTLAGGINLQYKGTGRFGDEDMGAYRIGHERIGAAI